MLTSTFDGYKTDLSLNVSLSEPSDFGTYYCISKNPKGLTKAAMELFGKKQGRAPFFFSNNTKPLFKLNFVGRNVFSGKWVLNNLTFTYLNWAPHIFRLRRWSFTMRKKGAFSQSKKAFINSMGKVFGVNAEWVSDRNCVSLKPIFSCTIHDSRVDWN